jgi:hypothetical protein
MNPPKLELLLRRERELKTRIDTLWPRTMHEAEDRLEELTALIREWAETKREIEKVKAAFG